MDSLKGLTGENMKVKLVIGVKARVYKNLSVAALTALLDSNQGARVYSRAAHQKWEFVGIA
jgi:hypothetical protein